MKFNHFDLLSPEPIYLKNVGGIISPTLRDISSIGYDVYQYYLSVLLLDTKSYFSMIGNGEDFEQLTDEEKMQFNIYDLLISNTQSIELVQEVLNFFIKEDVLYSEDNNCFIVTKKSEYDIVEKYRKKFLFFFNRELETVTHKTEDVPIGFITKENYNSVCELICKRNSIKAKHIEDMSKVKSKKALEIMKKLQKGREEKAKLTKADKNMELGNVVSAIANRSQSLNIINIWDVTVYQVWDCFARISNNNIYDIQSTSVAAYGNKDNYFDFNSWFKRIDESN